LWSTIATDDFPLTWRNSDTARNLSNPDRAVRIGDRAIDLPGNTALNDGETATARFAQEIHARPPTLN
jgi:hypothetical protein